MAGTNRRKKIDGRPAEPREGAEFLSDVIGKNIAVARTECGLSQDSLAKRMTELGHKWYGTTVGRIEKGERVVTVEELFGLSLALQTTVHQLLSPSSRGTEASTCVDLGPDSAVTIVTSEDLERILGNGGDSRLYPPLFRWEKNRVLSASPPARVSKLLVLRYRERPGARSTILRRLEAVGHAEDIPRPGDRISIGKMELGVLSVRVRPASAQLVRVSLVGEAMRALGHAKTGNARVAGRGGTA